MDKKQRTIRLIDLVHNWLAYAAQELIDKDTKELLWHHFTGYLDGVRSESEYLPEELGKFTSIEVEL